MSKAEIPTTADTICHICGIRLGDRGSDICSAVHGEAAWGKSPTTGPSVDPHDADRATEIRNDAYFPNETSTTHALLALQIVLLQDIRFYLQNLDEIMRNK